MKTPTGEHWRQHYLANERLHDLLEKGDAELAETARQAGCQRCGGKLHRADYERKPRGGPPWDSRHSFCCGKEGCRRRCTPPSLRFMGRRVYAAMVVVLVSAMQHGLKPERVQRLREMVGVDRRTLERWRQWWLGTLVESSFWKGARARFVPPLCQQTLPWSLWLRFEVEERRDRLLDLLTFLAPLTTPEAWRELAG